MHQHGHSHAESYSTNAKALGIALSITTLMMVLEFVGGLLSGSLALLSDAGHMLTDTGALALALFALWFSRRPATHEKTFGFYRAEILSALLNGSLLIVIAGYIFYEAFQRFMNPTEVHGVLMLSVAGIGLVANIAGALVLSRGSQENLNVRGALWHIISDALSSVGVIIGGIIIISTRFYLIDPIIGFIIAFVILRGAWGLVRESVDVLLEATPRDIDTAKVIDALKGIPGVLDVHDVHIWTITSGIRAFSSHVLIEDKLLSECGDISMKIKDLLREKFCITHATLELECKGCAGPLVCPIENH